MFNQLPRFPQNEETKTAIQAAAGISPAQAVLLGEFLEGKSKPPEWSPDYWAYLQSGQAEFIELASLLDLRIAYGKSFLTTIRMCDAELIEGLSVWITLGAMTDFARAFFGDGDGDEKRKEKV